MSILPSGAGSLGYDVVSGGRAHAVAAALLDAARVRVPRTARTWLDVVDTGAPAPGPRVVAAYVEAPRRLGRRLLGLGPAELDALRGAGLTWSLDAWRLEDAVRAAWLIAVAAASPRAALEALVEDVYRAGDGGAQASTLRALPLLPDAGRFLIVALHGCRAATRPVLEAIACDNPYAAAHFHDVHFAEMAIRAVRADLAAARIVGLERRLTPELATHARRFADERRAAGRAAPADLWRLTGGFRPAA